MNYQSEINLPEYNRTSLCIFLYVCMKLLKIYLKKEIQFPPS